MPPLSALPVILFVTVFVGLAVLAPLRRQSQGMRRGVAFASAIVVTGAVGFFGQMLSAYGVLNWLPQSVEWPIGSADGVVRAGDRYVVPHRYSGRVQVYDRDWRFLRGWPVPGGVKIKLVPAGDDRVEVVTFYSSAKYTYTLDGELVASGSYAPASFSSFAENGQRCSVPTPPLLWLFANPGVPWAVMAVGLLIFFRIDRSLKRSPEVVTPVAN